MRFKLTILSLFILSCPSSFATCTALAQENMRALNAVSPTVTSADASEVMDVVTAFTDAMVSGRNADAAALYNSSSDARQWLSRLRSLQEEVSGRAIDFSSIQLTEKNGAALAISQAIELAQADTEHGTRACLHLGLKRIDQKWRIARHGLVSPQDASQVIERFLQASADARTIPFIKAVATEPKQAGGENDLDGYFTPATSPQVDVESLNLKLKQIEELTAKMAHEVNAASDKSKDVLRSRLRREVQSSFEARLQLQRAELQKVREQLNRIEKSIETRERIKDEIIEHRVEELLNPELYWTPSGGNVSARAIGTGTGKVIELRGRREDVDNVREAIEQSPSHLASPRAETNTDRSTKPLWRRYGVSSVPVSDLTAKVLEWIGLHLNPITEDRFRGKNVFADYSNGLDVTFVRSDNGPAGIAGVHESDIVVRIQDRPVASLQEMDSALQDAVKQIRQGATDSLQFDVLRSGKTVRVNVPLPVSELNL